MAKHNDKNNFIVLAILLLVVLLSVAIRITYVPEEVGWDSYFIHGYALSIAEEGHVSWSMHPLSLWGLYPYSYASGVPAFLASLSALTGLDVSTIIFFKSLLLGVLSVFSAYLMASAFFTSKSLRLLVALAFSVSLDVLYLTTWTTSARGLFIVFAPVLFFSLFKLNETKNVKYAFLSFIIFLIMSLAHNMFLLGVLILLAFIAVRIIHSSENLKHFFSHGKNAWIFLGAFIALIFLPHIKFFSSLIPFYSSRFFHSDYLLWGAEYLRSTGLLFPFFIAGFLVLLFKSERSLNEDFIVLFLLLSAPFIALRIYMATFLLPVISLLVTIGLLQFYYFIKDLFDSKAIAGAALGVLLVVAVSVSALFQVWHPDVFERRNEGIHERYMEDSSKSLGSWLDESTSGRIISNDNVNNYRLNTVVPCRILYGEAEALSCGFVSRDDIGVYWRSPADPLFWRESPVAADYIFRYHMDFLVRSRQLGHPDAAGLISSKDIRYFLDYKSSGNNSLFVNSVRDSQNKVYDNRVNEVWHIT